MKNETRYLRLKDVIQAEREIYVLPHGTLADRPVVAGFGPAGMYAALILAEAGARPIVIERGKPADKRAEDVERFFREGILDEESNVQYGEGGAGTFSDGKLTTRIKNHRIRKVLEEFVEAGADPAILYQHMPHLGTDVLRGIVTGIRKKIISLGGEVLFETRLDSLLVKDGRLAGIVTNRGEIPCSRLVLALGHSPRATYERLLENSLCIEQKDFAVGVRAEHPQAMIDINQYGAYAGHPALGAASYRLSHTAVNGRGVYSFCMCPGGMVIPAPAEAETLAVNGMSYAARNGRNANAAILVQVHKHDFDHGQPLDGFSYQSAIEKRFYRRGYAAPAQNIRDFLKNQVSDDFVIAPSFPRGAASEDMRQLFAEDIVSALLEAFPAFDRKIPGFVEKGIMIGCETRSSSPIRIPRDDNGVSLSVAGVYPCGEGAGYAGGIVSSAVDGIRQAENILLSAGE